MNWTRQLLLILLIYSLIVFGVGFYSGCRNKKTVVVNKIDEKWNTTSEILKACNTTKNTATIEYLNATILQVNATYIRAIENSDYEKTIDNFSNKHTWSKTYNCQNGSWDLARELSWKGYEASVECGYYYGNNCDPDKDYWDCRHCWVNLCLKVEPFSGEILTPKEFKEMYGR
jgi:hypothetical protein